MDLEICNGTRIFNYEYPVLQVQDMKGDDIQKLSVIQALPQLLQYDPNGTLTRIIPRIQQELPKSSCEFHVATSKIFRLLIEKQLPLNLTGAVLQGTESKDPIVCNAWTETLLAIIPLLSIDQIKSNVIPLASLKSQPSSPVYSRIASCKVFGKCASHPKIEAIDVKTSILPAVQSLCQDCFQDVRATMCSQLHLVAQGLGENLVKSSLLPSLVELASDDNMSVRSASVACAVLITPFLNKQTKIDTIVPLIKQLCQKASSTADSTFPTIAREYGRLVDALMHDLDVADSVWFLQFFKTLATKGQQVRLNKDNMEVTQDFVCREYCAYNLPAVTLFMMTRIPDTLELWHSVFSTLSNDSCYLVRKTTAGCIHEVVKILGAQCRIIKDDFVKLLRDDAEEVLQMLVPHVGITLEMFCDKGVLSRETTLPASLEIARALLKCQMELSRCHNWRIKAEFLKELEHLPNCFPSDFIYQHFSPVILNCVLEARAKPVRSQASKTLLVFLRYNVKEIQRKWIRDNLVSHLCYAKSCYTRQVYVMACGHAINLFSNAYFKKHFFEPLLSLSDDPVSNIRLSVVGFLPNLFKMLVMPDDKKLQMCIDNVFSKLEMVEKDKDVKDVVRNKLKEIRSVAAVNKMEYLTDQRRKEDEENKIHQGKSITTAGAPIASKTQTATPLRDQTRSRAIIARSTSAPPRLIKNPSGQLPSDMSFLEQHFYIDAGISLPCNKIGTSMQKTSVDNIGDSVALSAETIDTISVNELKKLEILSSNMTDDVKMDLRKRNKPVASSSDVIQTFHSANTKSNRRYSSASMIAISDKVSTSNNQKTALNRRSLNILFGGDLSKIPVSIKKSKSNADVNYESKNNFSEQTVHVANNGRTCNTLTISEIASAQSELPIQKKGYSMKSVLSKNTSHCRTHLLPTMKPSNLPVSNRRSQIDAKRDL